VPLISRNNGESWAAFDGSLSGSDAQLEKSCKHVFLRGEEDQKYDKLG